MRIAGIIGLTLLVTACKPDIPNAVAIPQPPSPPSMITIAEPVRQILPVTSAATKVSPARLSRETAMQMQETLALLGLYQYRIDGKVGPRTLTALAAYRAQQHLPAWPLLDHQVLFALTNQSVDDPRITNLVEERPSVPGPSRGRVANDRRTVRQAAAHPPRSLERAGNGTSDQRSLGFARSDRRGDDLRGIAPCGPVSGPGSTAAMSARPGRS